MLQNRKALSFYKAGQKLRSDGLLARDGTGGIARPLCGNRGKWPAPGQGVYDPKARRVEAFWRAYWDKGGRFYGPVLTRL